MKTIFFIFRLFSNPFKVINSMVFNKGGKRDNAIVKTLKLCLWLVFGIITTITLVVVLAEDKENGIFLGSQQDDYTASVYGVEEEEQQQLLPNNPDGTANGLNLQLIDSIQTEGYVKEYLTLCRSNYNGHLNSIGNNIPIELVIASSLNESGTYPGTPLPISYLPWDGSSSSVVWKKSYSGYPAEALTLSKLNRNVISQPSIGGTGSLVTNSGADSIGHPEGDYSVTQFQFNMYGPTSSFSPEWKSNMNGYNESSNRSTDIIYFPDQLTALSSRYDSNVSSYITEQIDDIKYKKMIYSFNYNPGWGNIEIDVMNGYSTSDTRGKEILDMLYDELEYVFIKYGDYLASFTNFEERKFHAAIYVPLLEERGWELGSNKISYAYADCSEAIDYYGYSGGLDGFISRHTGNFSLDIESKIFRTTPSLRFTKNGITIGLDGIALGHLYSKVFVGQSIYAKMLKYAGVNVDPTNPNSYMNTLPEGEWKPGGDSVWMTNEKVDMDKLTEDGEKVLNAGYKYLGIPYIYGGNDPNVGIDCSRFVQLVYKDAFGLDIPRATPGQVPYTTRIENKYQDAIPGDLVFYYADSSMSPASSMHVAIFMGWDGDQPRIMHASQPGDVVKISTWDGRGTYDYWDIRRVPGFNGS